MQTNNSNTASRNRRKTQRFSDIIRLTNEVLNPRVSCGFSREGDEAHAAPGISDPFNKVLDKSTETMS